MRLDYSIEAKSLRKYIRSVVDDIVDSMSISRKACLQNSNGEVHLATFQSKSNDNSDKLKMFLLNRAQFRTKDLSARVNPSLGYNQAQAWIDFGRKVEIDLDSNGNFKAPDFDHICIISFR